VQGGFAGMKGTHMRLGRFAGVFSIVVLVLLMTGATAAQARTVKLREYRLSAERLSKLRTAWHDRLASRYGQHRWAPMRIELTNRDLRLMGLPPKRVLIKRRYRRPTAVYRSGKMVRLGSRARRKGKPGGGGSNGTADSPGVITFAGAGFFGIRPGAWLLLINGNSVGWCSMAHVYGAPGSYAISTAGHCGKPGDIATVVGAVGNRTVNGVPVPVLLDFGSFKTSHDGGLGNDWALISIRSQYQHLVTPTMAFWGGPIGMYTSQGEVVDVNLTGNQPSIGVNPNPALAQQVVHYGHGTGIGAGGTPRSGSAIAWGASHFMFFGAITPGDSGSGANTLTGDAVGNNREAAGIMTHIYIDPLMRQGLGIMGGTRATKVAGTLANGQILPYPAPVPLLP
jgi:hypothetical protein